jgi:hypothetical protein
LVAVCVFQVLAAKGIEGGLHARENAASPLVPRDVVVLSESELVANAAAWISGFCRRATGTALPVGGKERLREAGPHIVAVVGEPAPFPAFRPVPEVGAEGFVLQRVEDSQAGEVLVCWSPSELGCRYGLIEILRLLRVDGGRVSLDVARAVERPQFSMRIAYVNFAEHLGNAFNPNFVFDTPRNRWSDEDWERFIDMVSAFRFNVFEYWVPPVLFGPEALRGGKLEAEFAATMNRVTAYARRRGVTVEPLAPVNTVGANWHFNCPNDPKERAEILALWDYWSRALTGYGAMGLFPGDPGGCTRNGCTAETYVDLCLELSRIVRTNNPAARIEVATWGEPIGGWGVPLWTGDTNRAARAMEYLLKKLPEFPPGTFTSINTGFTPDCEPTNSHGGDGRPFAKRAAQTRAVITWDYSVTEGEGTVAPHCRIRSIFDHRREEEKLGCYSGGICYTMAPRLNCASLFASAEAWWNPEQDPESVLREYARLVFGPECPGIGPLLEEFEVVPDWGYHAPFPYSPERLQASMAKLQTALGKIPAASESRLPLASTLAGYKENLLFYTRLFGQLADCALKVEELGRAARPAGLAAPVSLDDALARLAEPGECPGREALQKAAEQAQACNAGELRQRYWQTVYGIYDEVHCSVPPDAGSATEALVDRFQVKLAVAHEPSAFEKAARAAGGALAFVPLGRPTAPRGWKLSGWTANGEDHGERWAASFDKPGSIMRDDFKNEGYRWLAVRLTEGPVGDRKKICINGQLVGEFVRTGPAASAGHEWWVTRSFAIPEGALKDGRIEITFSEPGIAISAVALTANRVADTEK